ncbi:MAG: hypothetical protein P4M02_06875, partial [Clostridia bacterium]|nr:hypothetical protein [Clostridia bacterium]
KFYGNTLLRSARTCGPGRAMLISDSSGLSFYGRSSVAFLRMICGIADTFKGKCTACCLQTVHFM